MTVVRVAVVASLAAVGLALTPAAAQAKSPTVYQVRTSGSTTLATAGGVQTTVESLSLPKGSWTASSDVTAIDFGAGDYVRCHLQVGSSTIDGGQTVYLADRVSGLHNVGTVTLTAPGTVVVLCDHDSGGSAGQFYVDPGATLTAVEGGPIGGPGTTVKKPVVVEARSTASTSLMGNSYTTVTSATLPKGTWAITANASAVNFSDFDFVACSVVGIGASVPTNQAQAGTENTDAIVTGLDVETTATVTAKTSTVQLRCASDFENSAYIDSGATLTATKVTTSDLRLTSLGSVALPDAAGGSATVGTATIPAGAWRVRSDVQIGNQYPNNSVGNGQDFVRCSLAANGTAIDGGATELITTDSNIQMVVNAGSYTSKASWTLTLRCSHDAQNSTGAHWTVLDGALQSVDKGPIG